MHLVLELAIELVFDFTDGCLVELCHGAVLSLFVDLFQLTFQHGATLRKLVIEELLEDLVGILHGFLALILANVAPRGLDAGDGARIDGVHVRLGQIVQHFTVQRLAIQLLRLDPVHYFPAQSVHLFNKLRTQVIQGDICQVLQLVFLGEGPNHGATVAFFEEALEQASNSILLIDCFTEAFLRLQGLF